MQSEELLLFAADAAKLVLENGGETYRAEETAMDIIHSQGGAEAECFATSTGIILSFTGEDGRVRAIVRRVNRRSMNLEKVCRIDRMVRRLKTDRLTFSEAARELDLTDRMRENPIPVKILTSATGTAFFTLLFNGGPREAAAAAVIGACVSVVVMLIQRWRLPDFMASLVGGAFAALASLFIQHLGLIPTSNITIIGVIMLLVPGLAITNAIRDMIAGDLVSGLARSVDALLTAAAISAGTGGAFAIWKYIMPAVKK